MDASRRILLPPKMRKRKRSSSKFSSFKRRALFKSIIFQEENRKIFDDEESADEFLLGRRLRSFPIEFRNAAGIGRDRTPVELYVVRARGWKIHFSGQRSGREVAGVAFVHFTNHLSTRVSLQILKIS